VIGEFRPARAGSIRKISKSIGMFKNYLKLALRNIARKKLYTAINLTGLGVASAFCILAYWYFQHESSFDKFHANKDQLYRVEFSNFDEYPSSNKPNTGFFSFLTKDAGQQNTIQTPIIFAGVLQRNFPEIEHAVRIEPGYQLIVRVNNQSFKEENNSAFVDKDFFSVFSFPLIKGNAATVLSNNNQIVLSERAAKKYFGNSDPVGKAILLPQYENTLYTVSGVAKNFPANSSFQYDFIMPRESVPDYNEEVARGLNTFSDLLIIQLKKGADATAFAKKFDAFCRNYFQPTLKEWASFPGSELKPENFHAYIRPFADAHYNAGAGWGHYTNLSNIYQLCSLAIIILIIACLNYILLTLTGTVSRSDEVGIRKTIGAPRMQIILQFYVETQVLAFFAVLIGLILALSCLPLFSNLIGLNIQFSYFSFADVLLLLVGLALLLGIFAGVYPALVLSGLKPLNMMRKFSAFRLNPLLARVLMITQFSVCIILIISSLVISSQMKFINTTKLGFDEEQVLTIDNPFVFDNDMNKSVQLKERLYHFASMEPSIQNITANGVPFEGFNNTNNHIINGEKTMVHAFDVDYNYFSFFKIPILKGRSFLPGIKGDSAHLKLTDAQTIPGSSAARRAVVVNETLYKLLGKPQLNIFNKEIGGPIIGVCADYHSEDLTKKISPVYHRIYSRYIGNFSLKIKANQNIPQVVDKIKKNWDAITVNAPFSFTFLDENVQKSYDAYKRWMQTVTASCLLAIIIASLGLFGLSGLTAISRIKEIGIRKILGASSASLFLMLNKNTFITAIISFVIAIPVAVYLVNEWLQNFAYHIKPGWFIYVLAGIISIATALIAVSYHAIKTANANPVKSLRTE
jgi:putative ABC transport system permease protein